MIRFFVKDFKMLQDGQVDNFFKTNIHHVLR